MIDKKWDLVLANPNKIVIQTPLFDFVKKQQDPLTISLAESILIWGQLLPIFCRRTKNDNFLLIRGLRRYLAIYLIRNGFTNSEGQFIKIDDFKLICLVSDNLPDRVVVVM